MSATASLDAVLPPRGPCGLCGHPDARHRICDAVAERLRAGDTVADIATDYDLPETDLAVVAAWGDAPHLGWLGSDDA